MAWGKNAKRSGVRRFVYATASLLICGVSVQHVSAQNAKSNIIDLKTGDQYVIEDRSGQVKLFGRQLRLDDYSGVAGLSSETAYVLVVAGRLEAGEISAKPGDVLIIPTFQKPFSKQKFDAERFAKSAARNGTSWSVNFTDRLNKLVQRQSVGIFWGRYESTNLNLAAPQLAEPELARRSVVGSDIVQNIRFTSEQNLSDIEAETVRQAAIALKTGNAQNLAHLLDPTSFGAFDLRGGGNDARLLMAESILQSRNWSVLLREETFQKSDTDGVWVLRSPGQDIAVSLRPFGDFLFIASIGGEA